MPQGVFVINKIKEQRAFGADSGTETVDLPTSNYLNSLLLRVQNTNGATSNTARTIQTDIDKIEITADGIPVYSVTGEMAASIAHFDVGRAPASNESQDASKVQYQNFPIMFGRHDTDKEVLLPAHKFATLQLKIEYSFSDSGTTGYATSETNAKYDLLGKYLVSPTLEDTPFLKHIEVYSKSLGTIQIEEVDLPTGAGNGAYRRIFMRVYEGGIEDGIDVDKFELLVNDSQRIVDQRWLTSQAEDQMRYNCDGSKAVAVFVAAASATAFNSKVSNIKGIGLAGSVADMVIGVDALAGDLVSFDSENTSSEIVYTNISADGVPFSTVIDLGTDNIEDSLDVGEGSGVSSLKIKLNVAAAGSVGKVVTEQLVLF